MTPHQPRSRRTLVPFVLLLCGLLGIGPFVSPAFAAEPTPAMVLDSPGLAGWLGVALAIAALAGVAIAARAAAHRQVDEAEPSSPDDAREVDPLLAALRGAAAFAPDDRDPRLVSRTSVGSPSSAGDGPLWIRRIDPRRVDQPIDRERPDSASQTVRDADASWR